MNLNKKTLEKLRILINEETQYRSGPQLVDFFNEIGFSDSYGQGFPSRWLYTDDKLKKINGTPELDKCIKNLFSPINFVNKIQELDTCIKDFNQYLSFDGWNVVRKNKNITFVKKDKIDWLDGYSSNSINDENTFLEKEFSYISFDKLGLNQSVRLILENRMEEVKKCLNSNAPLSVIFLCGSILEGLLLNTACSNPKKFNTSKSAPKKPDGKVKKFPNWTLNNFIDSAYEIGILKDDVKKFSHALRDFRNYIHPYEQMNTGFSPDLHTAKICFQVLKAVINQLNTFNQIIKID
ncbi:hypothetical protein IMX26_17155 [Clostridium sp. 'deep sea']|uniref:hypothetical protein n=1 Tax=Clostridium sp. 'deep sea' TaxID=2779445 RepID=UPI0018964A0B|nr:hypothetical protein [Clostridium sp. 'deep sea']QOR35162.1 hypothetical protein IMX26_17155 [Clostridium sp. 'deep sea']